MPKGTNATAQATATPQPKQPTQLEKLFLTAEEVAFMLGVKRTTAYKLGTTGEIPTVTIFNKAKRFPRVAVEQYVARLCREQGVEVEG